MAIARKPNKKTQMSNFFAEERRVKKSSPLEPNLHLPKKSTAKTFLETCSLHQMIRFAVRPIISTHGGLTVLKN